jgi:hypothetical protein
VTTTTDSFGRTVTYLAGPDYNVTASDGTAFTVDADSLADALTTINAMAPAGWVATAPPAPTTISAGAFFGRFTPAEQAAVQAAAIASPAISVGLLMGAAAGQVSLTGAPLIAWMASLVTAGAITSGRSTVILTP